MRPEVGKGGGEGGHWLVELKGAEGAAAHTHCSHLLDADSIEANGAVEALGSSSSTSQSGLTVQCSTSTRCGRWGGSKESRWREVGWSDAAQLKERRTAGQNDGRDM